MEALFRASIYPEFVDKMQKINFSDMLDFCFQQSHPDKYEEIVTKVLTDDDYFYMIRGIKEMQKRLKTRERVEEYLNTQKKDLIHRLREQKSLHG